MGGLESGPRFSFETGHCNLKKSALLQMSDLSFCPVYSTGRQLLPGFSYLFENWRFGKWGVLTAQNGIKKRALF